MRTEPDLEDYTTVEELEDLIDEVYRRSERLNNELRTLEDQAEAFFDYRHDPEKFRESAEYVSKNIPDEAWPRLTKSYAQENFENPEEADNWDNLLEAERTVANVHDTWMDIYTGLWNEFDYTGDRLQNEIEGIPPVEHFINTWEERPYKLFDDIESYDGMKIERDAEGSRPTMARQFEIEDPTLKQKHDMMRAKKLERQLQEMERPATMQSDQNYWREQLVERPNFSKWVNEEKIEE